MSTATKSRRHTRHPRPKAAQSPFGFTLYIRNRRGLTRVELTRKQAEALQHRLAKLLAHEPTQWPKVDLEQWCDPEIM